MTNANKLTFNSPQEAFDFLEAKLTGRMFGAQFTKKDGEKRAGVFIRADKIKGKRHGGSLPYDPREKGCYPAYEMVGGSQDEQWKMINLAGLERLRIEGVEYQVEVQP